LQEESFKYWQQWNKEWEEDLYHQDGILALSRNFKVSANKFLFVHERSIKIFDKYN